MDKKNLVKIINKELTILTDLVDSFANNNDIHPFEIDLAISKTKDIYGELLLLKNDKKEIKADLAEVRKESKSIETEPGVVEMKVEAPKEKELPEIIEETDAITREVVEDGVEEEYIIHETVEDKTPEEKKSESVILNGVEEEKEETMQVEPEKEIVEENVESEEEKVIEETSKPMTEEVFENEGVMESEKETNGTIIADKFQNQQPSVNDMLAGIKKDKDLASRLKDRPVTDLKSAIKINDRIWFINELFNKDAKAYEAAIDVINKSENLDNALEFLFTNYKWDQNKKSTVNFLELVFRRFANQ